MGVWCSRKKVTFVGSREVNNSVSIGDDEDGSSEGKRNVVEMRQRTTHQNARGCCAGFATSKRDLYITKTTEIRSDGSKTVYKERRMAAHKKNGVHSVTLRRYKKEIDPTGKKGKYVKQEATTADRPRFVQ
mmetsp:Transcript_7811/g.14538  ORF Transcript_7811/g.14538 Transcript_7811/m.14538 type:complete len:131 (-) Transcript_7811:433-825(-)|eukprot:CAMPEP_0197515510 /NCGR_PEP_ID=MMETSP1318-20131121/629_1 /TAXON_ID=552666 /ORGANISM="Partenskyella glossopodia, Strain RCC365" /LENGTH=130 /DNA_ID=CAMNT_0043063907 /DNA_START=121 /DNA_END=513 /DNA_ORIENTATION=+